MLTGDVQQGSWEQWQEVINRYVSMTKNHQHGSGIAFAVDDLFVSDLTAFGRQWADVNLAAWQQGDYWLVDIEQAMIDGQFLIPLQSDEAIVANIQRLTLDVLEQGNTVSERGSAEAELDPRVIVSANVVINELYQGADHLGGIAFDIRHVDHGVRIQNVEGNFRGIELGVVDSPLVLLWLRDGESSRTFFNGGLLFRDIGNVLERWGYERAIESKEGFIDLSLAWNGQPDQWSMAKSRGSIDLVGRFLSTSGTASGALKVVGVVNFANLTKRLKLDFSDVYEEGVSFNSVRGDFDIDDGWLLLNEGVTIKSPSSRFLLKGEADLVEEQLDMELVATLPVATNLPWFAALAGGLPAMAGAYVASKLFEEQLDKVSSAVYSIKGDWSNPKMKFERMFNDKSKKKKSSAVERSEGEPVIQRDTAS
jgi:uncharacterized protein YhdP